MTDHLSRQPFIDLLKNIIENQAQNGTGYSIAIDGDWGSGKSWILSELESQLDNKYLVFHYNAWENDFYEEPLVALLSVMIDKLNVVCKQESFYESAVNTLLKEVGSDLRMLVSGIVKTVIKIDIDKSIKSKKGLWKRIKQGTQIQNDINSMLPLQNTITKVRKGLEDISKELHIVIVVDELDRCLPEYAIRVLERLHHVCNELPVFQIIAINKKDLSFGICKVFGMGNKNIQNEKYADKYLQKFIQLTIPLKNGVLDTEKSILNGMEVNYVPMLTITKDYLLSFYQKLVNGISIRTQNYIQQQVGLAHRLTVLSGKQLKEYSYGLLCCELLWCITKVIFKERSGYSVGHIQNSLELNLKSNINSTNGCQILDYGLFNSNITSIFHKRYEFVSNKVDEYSRDIVYVSYEEPSGLLLNYFLRNYDSGPKWPDIIELDSYIIPERDFLKAFIKILDNF